MENRHQPLIHEIFHICRKIVRTRNNTTFLEKCIHNGVNPNFTRFSRKFLREVNWSKEVIHQKRTQHTNKTILTNHNIISNLNSQLNQLKSIHFHNSSLTQTNNSINHHFQKANTHEHKHKHNLERKFNNLMHAHHPHNQATIHIYNDTNISIPPAVINCLKFSGKRSIGGSPDTIQILKSFQYLIDEVEEYCKEQKLDKLLVDEIKTKIKLQFHALRKSFSSSDDFKIVKTFLQENPNYLFLSVDKSESLRFCHLNDYKNKLSKILNSENYRKIDYDHIELNYSRMTVINDLLKPFIDDKLEKQIRPNYNARIGFGISKESKPDKPLRLIVSSINSISANLEQHYLLPILRKIENFAKFQIKDTKTLKENILKIRDQYDPKKHCFYSLDIVKMYDNVPVNDIIKFIADKIYCAPENYFPKLKAQNARDSTTEHVPPKSLFISMLRTTLKDFSTFNTLIGNYQQTKGVSMGGKISGIVASTFAAYLENSIISKKIRDGSLLLYNRFADDSLVIGTKESKLKLFSELNLASSNFSYTIEHSKNSKLNFLDTTLSFSSKTKKLELQHFEKTSKSQVTINFKKSLAPSTHKRNAIIGACNRIRNACTNSDDEEKAFEKLKSKMALNSFPKHYCADSISKFKDKQNNEVEEHDKKLYLGLTFTSERCNIIHKNMINIFKTHLPKFKLIISWKCIRMNSILTPLTKPKKDTENRRAGIYQFQCSCLSNSYIGHTKRIINTRLTEHNTKSRNTEIGCHIQSCEIYQNALKTQCGPKPKPKEKKKFFLSHVNILKDSVFDFHDRTFIESYYIHFAQPSLNKQKKHKKITII